MVFYGRGAGKLPTASAVVGDVIDCVRHIDSRKFLYWEDGEPGYVADFREAPTRLYVRLKVEDPAAMLQKIKALFKNPQFLHRENAPDDEIAFVTGVDSEYHLDETIGKLTDDKAKLLSKIRIADY